MNPTAPPKPRFPRHLAETVAASLGEALAPHCLRIEIAGTITRRLSTLGRPVWGGQNKLATHVPTGILVDFFATSELAWFNTLVVRTGPASLNARIAAAARAAGWKWNT